MFEIMKILFCGPLRTLRGSQRIKKLISRFLLQISMARIVFFDQRSWNLSKFLFEANCLQFLFLGNAQSLRF